MMHTPESASRDRCSFHPDRCCDEHRPEQVTSGYLEAMEDTRKSNFS